MLYIFLEWLVGLLFGFVYDFYWIVLVIIVVCFVVMLFMGVVECGWILEDISYGEWRLWCGVVFLVCLFFCVGFGVVWSWLVDFYYVWWFFYVLDCGVWFVFVVRECWFVVYGFVCGEDCGGRCFWIDCIGVFDVGCYVGFLGYW